MSVLPDLDRKNSHHLCPDVFWYGVLQGSILTYIGVYAARLGATSFQSGLLTAGPAAEALASIADRSICFQSNLAHPGLMTDSSM